MPFLSIVGFGDVRTIEANHTRTTSTNKLTTVEGREAETEKCKHKRVKYVVWLVRFLVSMLL